MVLSLSKSTKWFKWYPYYIVRFEKKFSLTLRFSRFNIPIHMKMVFENTTHIKLILDFIAFSLFTFRTLLRMFSLLRRSLSSLNFDCLRKKNAFSIEEQMFILLYGENEMINASLKAFRTHLKLPSKWKKEGVSQDCFLRRQWAIGIITLN